MLLIYCIHDSISGNDETTWYLYISALFYLLGFSDLSDRVRVRVVVCMCMVNTTWPEEQQLQRLEFREKGKREVRAPQTFSGSWRSHGFVGHRPVGEPPHTPLRREARVHACAHRRKVHLTLLFFFSLPSSRGEVLLLYVFRSECPASRGYEWRKKSKHEYIMKWMSTGIYERNEHGNDMTWTLL